MTIKIGESFFQIHDSNMNIKPIDLFNSLNEYIVGQEEVKKVIALSYVDRMSRMKSQNEDRKITIITKKIIIANTRSSCFPLLNFGMPKLVMP